MKKDFRKEVINYFKKGNIIWVTLFILGLSFLSLIFGATILRIVYEGDLPPIAAAVNWAIALTIFGFAGLVQILRKEAPGAFLDRPLRGTPAVLYGLFIVVVFWGASFITLLTTIKG